MRTPLLLSLPLGMLLVGCTAMRDVPPNGTGPAPIIPAVDVNVEVQEAPGLFQVTK